MKKITFLITAMIYSLVGCVEKSELVILNLKCENLSNPLGIDKLHPRFSWKLESNKRNQKQSAYHILVSESSEELDKNNGEIWDSKKIESDQSTFNSFDGKTLESGKQYFWKVKVWDWDGEQTAWSNTSHWTMGLLKHSDWNAKWIGRRNKDEKDTLNQYAAVQFRKVAALNKKPVKALARFCGLGFGELYINGQKVSKDKMAPGWTDYTKKVCYMTYDVTDQLQQGENAVGVLLGNGWYNLPTADLFAYEKAPWKSPPKFLVNITLSYVDGSTSEIVSDETWTCRNSHITFNCIRGGETIDARKVQQDWDKAIFDDKDWDKAQAVTSPTGKLSPQLIAAEKVRELIKPIKLTEPKPGVFVYDLGVHIAGWVQFKASGKEGQIITLDFDENLNDDGTITIKSLNSHTHGRYQVGKLILSGKGPDVFEPRFAYHGFRYIQVMGLSSRPELSDLIAHMVHTDIASSGSFECSKELLNKVHGAFRYAILNSLHSVQTEPAREKINWTQDAHNITEGIIFNFDSYTFVNKWLDDVLESQESNGHVPPINPAANWGFTKPNGMPPDWSDPWWGGVILEIPWFIYSYYGDVEVLKRSYEQMRKFVDYLGTTATDSVFLDWWLGDWLEVDAPPSGRPVRTPIIQTSTTAYFYYASLLGKIAKILGMDEDSKKYSLLAERIKKGYNERFLNNEGWYAEDSQTAQIMPLYLGLAPEEKQELILRRLLENIKQRKGHLSSGFVGYLFLFNGLTSFGHSDVAYEMATKEDYPGWGFMLKDGGTTLWESWKGIAYNFGSLGGIDSWYFKVLAGINSTEESPGFKHIIINPNVVGDLSWVKGSYNTQYGKIGSFWKIESDSLFMDIIIPVNTSASVYIPSDNIKQIKESGKPVLNSDEIKFERKEKGKTILSVGSGTYHFAVPIEN